MDDDEVIIKNQSVQKGFAGIKELFGQPSDSRMNGTDGPYRPVTTSLFAIEKHFFGNASSGYHFMNVLLFAILCVVLFFLLRRLLKNYHPLLPLIATLFFAAHPIHTEVVANIKSADEILSLLFCLLALLYAFRFSETSSWKYAGVSSLCFTCAMFSKENSITFLLIIPAALYFFTQESFRTSRKNILKIFILHFSVAGIYFIARSSVLNQASKGIILMNNALAGVHSLPERWATAFAILLQYIKLLFYPHALCWDYSFNQIPLVSFSDPAAILSLLIYASLGTFSLWVLFKPTAFKSADSSMLKLFSFCILFYLFSLSVTSNIFILINATMAERFLFTPSLAFCILAAFFILRISKYERSAEKKGNKIIFISLTGIILILYSFKTHARNKDWKNNFSLFAKGVETCPNSWRTNVDYAWESSLAGDAEKNPEKKKEFMLNAVKYYQKGLTIYDTQIDAIWYSYGVANSSVGNMDEAVKAYQRAIAINAKHIDACNNLATIYFSRSDLSNSIKYFLMAYKIDSTASDIPFKIGVNYQLMNDMKNAAPYYENYLRRYPNDKNVITNLAIVSKALIDSVKTNYYMGLLSKMGVTEQLQMKFITQQQENGN